MLYIIIATIIGAIVISFILFMALDAYEHRQFDKEYKYLLSKRNNNSVLDAAANTSPTVKKYDDGNTIANPQITDDNNSIIATTVVATILYHNSFNSDNHTQDASSGSTIDTADCDAGSTDGGGFDGGSCGD